MLNLKCNALQSNFILTKVILEMRKNFIYLGMIAMISASLTGCSDEPNDKNPIPDLPTTSNGAYILNQGNYESKIEGSLNFINYSVSKISRDLFRTYNKRSLGDTPQCGIAYGSKLYLGVYGSNTIEIIDKVTYKSLLQISLSDKVGQSPRSMVAKDGKVYVSMYNGYVCSLDTLTQTIDKTVKVGPNPEIIAIYDDKIFVPNSDGMNHPNYGKTASIIPLESFGTEETSETFEVPLNPKQFLTNGSSLFILALGNYVDIPNALYKVDSDYKCKFIANATKAAIKDNFIYIIDAPWGGKVVYSRYDINSEELTNLDIKNIDAPSGLGVDPITGNIFISSYPLDNGDISYSLPGYVCEYDSNGVYKNKYDSGVGDTCIFFDLE